MRLRPYDEIHDAVVGCLPPLVMQLLATYDTAYVAGGFIRDVASYYPYKDIDVYGMSAAMCLDAEPWMAAMGAKVRHEKHKTIVTVDVFGLNSDDTVLFWEPREVQLLHSEVKDFSVDRFDMGCCASICDSVTTDIHKATANGIIGLRTPGPHTLMRMLKLIKRGWECDVAELRSAALVVETFDESLGNS